MLRLLLADVNFNNKILRGLLLRTESLDIVRAQDVGLDGESDEHVLDYAATTNRILLTHDLSTIPPIAYKRVEEGKPMPGVFIIKKEMSIGEAIDELLLVSEASSPEEWRNVVRHLPI
jgi:hypothetical protein